MNKNHLKKYNLKVIVSANIEALGYKAFSFLVFFIRNAYGLYGPYESYDMIRRRVKLSLFRIPYVNILLFYCKS